MGLDNGIVVRKGKGRNPRVKDYWDGIDAGDDIEVAYWRKCWGIRDEILEVLGADIDGGGDYKLDLDKMRDVITVLKKFTKRDYWNENADSIWEFDEFKSNQRRIIRNLIRVYRWMKKEPDLEVYFYDSY